MAIQLLRDPRPYLLAVIPLGLAVIVPLTFVFVTMLDRVFGTGSGPGSIVLLVLVGIALAASVAGVVVMLARATRLEELEGKNWDDDGL
jgi:hypothetical protein